MASLGLSAGVFAWSSKLSKLSQQTAPVTATAPSVTASASVPAPTPAVTVSASVPAPTPADTASASVSAPTPDVTASAPVQVPSQPVTAEITEPAWRTDSEEVPKLDEILRYSEQQKKNFSGDTGIWPEIPPMPGSKAARELEAASAGDGKE
jgi:hypothetical protein